MSSADLPAPSALRRIVASLDAAGIPHMLTGSFASAFHGSPRATQDIDLVIEADEDRLRAFIRSLAPKEYYATPGRGPAAAMANAP